MGAPETPGAVLRVGGLTPLSTIDYPGQLSAVVFCQGCPWRCRYCHNPGLLSSQGAGGLPWSDLLGFLERRRGLLDAVVFSGGEPTLQVGLAGALAQVRAMGFRIGLHTAGAYPQRLERLLALIDWVGLDIKAAASSYAALTGVPGSGEAAWESAGRLIASGIDHEIRITAHPALLPAADLEGLICRLERMGVRRILVQPCRTESVLDPALGGMGPPDPTPYQRLLRHHPGTELRSGSGWAIPGPRLGQAGAFP
jgi:pyruvate formate lyase activating enzyme